MIIVLKHGFVDQELGLNVFKWFAIIFHLNKGLAILRKLELEP